VALSELRAWQKNDADRLRCRSVPETNCGPCYICEAAATPKKWKYMFNTEKVGDDVHRESKVMKAGSRIRDATKLMLLDPLLQATRLPGAR
jgi:hypothetical protein